MKNVYLVFLTVIDNQQHVILFQKNQSYKFLKTKATDSDFYSSSIAASKIILDQLGNIELQKFSFCKKEYLDAVDFPSYDEAVKHYWNQSSAEEKQVLRHVRNLQSHLWTQFFNQCLMWNNENETHFYYIINCQQQDVAVITSAGLTTKIITVEEMPNFSQKKNNILEFKNAILNKEHLRVDGRIVLHFNFKQKQHSVYEAPNGYLDTVAIYNGIFRRTQDNWNQYDVAQNNYPSDEILKRANLILMPGNRVSVYQGYQWIDDVKAILLKAYNINPKIKILGICFGFQILIEALGGKVEKMQSPGFVYGNTILYHNIEQMKKFQLFEGLQLKSQTIINQAHGDEIIKHPENFILLSSSDSCKDELMISTNEKILLFQGHPEYSTESMKLLSLSSRLPSSNHTLVDALKEVKRIFPSGEDGIHLQICLKFAKLI